VVNTGPAEGSLGVDCEKCAQFVHDSHKLTWLDDHLCKMSPTSSGQLVEDYGDSNMPEIATARQRQAALHAVPSFLAAPAGAAKVKEKVRERLLNTLRAEPYARLRDETALTIGQGDEQRPHFEAAEVAGAGPVLHGRHLEALAEPAR
jgi:hypothetical protein